jgi:hypothetical protein
MGEPKPLASLSGLLLARKGAARPAMRRPSALGNLDEAATNQDDLGWNDMGYDVNPDPSTPMDYQHESSRNPLANAVPDAKPEVRQQQERIAQQLQAQADAGFESLGEVADEKVEEAAFTADEVQTVVPVIMPAAPTVSVMPKAPVIAPVQAVQKPRARAASGSKGKAAFTLRLDTERHLKLRLACAVSNRSAQMLVTEALDQLLAGMPEIGQLAARVPAKK